MTKLTLNQIVKYALKNTKWLIFSIVSLYSISILANTVKPAWYRYYDHKGIANLSTTVSPNHIRHGYEALDRNMQVIQRTKPFNPDKASSHVSQSNAALKQKENDQRLKKAYGSSRLATQKRQESLNHINKQIQLQQQQLLQLQKDRLMFQKQEQQYTKKGLDVPQSLKNPLSYNQQYIQNGHQQLLSLRTQYQKCQSEYTIIIQRLKALE